MPTQSTHDQLVASIVHIQIERTSPPTLSVAPEPAHAFYTHDGGRGDEMKPHSVLWEVFDLQPGERIEIEANNILGLAPPHVPALVLRTLFEVSSMAPGVLVTPSPPATPRTPSSTVWTIPFGASSAESIQFSMPSDDLGRIRVKYDIRLFRDDALVALLDPGVHLIPDP